MNELVLRAERLNKSFGKNQAVSDLSFELYKGQCLALLGSNGAGKTTTIKMLFGFQTQDSGEIHYFGKRFAKHRDEIKTLIGVCSQEDNLDSDFTVRQNLEIFSGYFRINAKNNLRTIDELLDLVHLREKQDSLIHTLSGGMKKRLQLVRALIHKPKVVFLDEPTTGLDPEARREVWEFIQRIKDQEKVAVILTTHYMDEAERLSDNIILMQKGKKMIEGKWKDLEKEHFLGKILITPTNEAVEAWASQNKVPYQKTLNELNLEVSDSMRELFLNKFPDTDMNIRQPNLEDLYLKLTGVVLN